MNTWLQKIARAGAMAASNQFLGSNSMATPGAGTTAAPKLPSPAPNLKMQTPTAGPLDSLGVAQNTGATLNQQTISHGDNQNKVNTAPIVPGMIHPAHPNPNA
jgi:hypothetical protein